MIPQKFIDEWRSNAPWPRPQQVEQDLILSRALVEIYSEPATSSKLAFRGGTALHKLHLKKAARYSEDLDFIQIDMEPIGDTLDLVRSKLDPWLGTPKREFGRGLVKLTYRYQSEADNTQMKLKIEINSREHFVARHLVQLPFSLDSQWFIGSANVTSIKLDWLLGSKLRALYQRRKGRDLFDLFTVIEANLLEPKSIVNTFHEHLNADSKTISRAEFEKNMFYKLSDSIFIDDLPGLLAGDRQYDLNQIYSLVHQEILAHLPGEPWKGEVPDEDSEKKPPKSKKAKQKK